jgi:release factor glutamine methyltransferase
MTIMASYADALEGARSQGLDRLDAQLLLLHVLRRPQTDRAWLIAHDGDALDAAGLQHFLALCERRARGEPLAYLVETKEFFGLNFHVSPHVLVPRPDTETLVHWTMEHLTGNRIARVLDLGTGSGAIALAAAHTDRSNGGRTRFVATDASADALAVAERNRAALGLTDSDVQLIHGNWFEPIQGRFDLIVSNPPYIATGDAHLTALAHEPLTALTAGADGLADLRIIIAEAPGYLEPGGWLLLEHGYDQADATARLLTEAGFEQVQHRLDLAGVERCTGGCRGVERGGGAQKDVTRP